MHPRAPFSILWHPRAPSGLALGHPRASSGLALGHPRAPSGLLGTGPRESSGTLGPAPSASLGILGYPSSHNFFLKPNYSILLIKQFQILAPFTVLGDQRAQTTHTTQYRHLGSVTALPGSSISIFLGVLCIFDCSGRKSSSTRP